MRNFILAKKFVTGVSYEEMADGDLAIFASFGSEGINQGETHRSIKPSDAEDYRNALLTLVLKRSVERGGDIYSKNFNPIRNVSAITLSTAEMNRRAKQIYNDIMLDLKEVAKSVIKSK